jgi:hypothetical protein
LNYNSISATNLLDEWKKGRIITARKQEGEPFHVALFLNEKYFINRPSNKTWEEHLHHVDRILSIMEKQSLYAKESKFEFVMTEVLYLGHIIGVKGV